MAIIKRRNSQNLYIQFRLAGRTITRSARTNNRRAAEQMEVRLRAEAHAQAFLGQKPRLRFSEAFSRYANSRMGTPNYKNIIGHIRSITTSITNCPFLDGLTVDHIGRYLDDRRSDRVAAQTLKHGLAVIKGTVDLANAQGYRIPEMQLPVVKVSNKRLRYLSAMEEANLLQSLDPNRQGPGLHRSPNREPELRQQLQDLYDLVVLLLDTGARCSEIRSLRWRHVDLEAGHIHLWRPKVGNESLIFLTMRAKKILTRRQQQATSEYIFANKEGGPRNHPHVSWRKAFDRAGLRDCTIHTLRHTHASRLIQNGLRLYDVQTVLGHADSKTTMRYAHLEKAAVTARARDVINKLNGA